MKLFIVSFTRIGNAYPKPIRQAFEARTVEALEGPVKEWAEKIIGDGKEVDVTVTIDPDLMKGQLNYGLLGNFTISV